MADEKGGGRRGHPVKGKNVSGQYRALAAQGILKGGSGKKGTAKYSRKRAATVNRLRKRGVDTTSRNKASQVNKSGRHVFGGSKAAGLRGGGGRGGGGGGKRDFALRARPANKGPAHADWKNIHDPRSPNFNRRAEKRAHERNKGGYLPSRAGRFEGRSLNGQLGPLTRGERITRGHQALERFVGQRASRVRVATPAGRKEMPSRYDGRFADTGKPFKAGTRIYYDGSQRAAFARPGTLSLRKRPTFTTPAPTRAGEINRAAALATNSQLNHRGNVKVDARQPFGSSLTIRRSYRAGSNRSTSSVLAEEFKRNLKKAGLGGKWKPK